MIKFILSLTIGIVLFVVAAFTELSTWEFLQTATAVPGPVISLNAGGSHLQIEFVTRARERISYPQSGMIYGMSVGDRVTVLYRPDAPARTATTDHFGAGWKWTTGADSVRWCAPQFCSEHSFTKTTEGMKFKAISAMVIGNRIRNSSGTQVMSYLRKSKRLYGTGATGELSRDFLIASGGTVALKDIQQSEHDFHFGIHPAELRGCHV